MLGRFLRILAQSFQRAAVLQAFRKLLAENIAFAI